ncbi:Sec-independent protein translocase protein TatB [Roseibium sp. Sym1]|uniref:Sec-independent protein translocase protein TatB n=1 Tax=Roseibium sp. Sym1 TaxID=3016006 RepID=UPI0022B5AB17|nr:Sec-independent protein translocase protein TatB [Roseibium sp. Sym1]
MFDIGWTELLVIASVAIIVVGPKDLPRMLRTLGQTMGKMRRMSREFQSTFNDALREAEQQADIADMKKQVEDVGNFNPLGDLKKSIEEDGEKKKVVGKKPERPLPSKPAKESEAEASPEPEKNETSAPERAPDADAVPADPETRPDTRPVTEEAKA